MKKGRLLILDYSGTLSLEGPRFSHPRRLREELERSRLIDWGIDMDTFWREIVEPTWEEASTTPKGYTAAIIERIREIRPLMGYDDTSLKTAAEDFVRSYLDASVIAPLWAPLLRDLAVRETVLTVIATDHYAEATEAILRHLADLGVAGLSIVHRRPDCPERILVANSADLAAGKAQRLFWEGCRRYLSTDEVRCIILVDDFGCNEAPGDAYGEKEKGARRRRETEDVIGEVFCAPLHTLPFFAGCDDADGVIRETTARLRILLSEVE